MRTIKGLLTKASTKLPVSHIRVWVDPDNNKAPILDLNGENIILKNSAVKQQIIDVISREDVDWVIEAVSKKNYLFAHYHTIVSAYIIKSTPRAYNTFDFISVRNYSDYWSMKYFKCKIVVKTISPITERNAYSDLRKHFVNEFGYF